MRNKRIFLTFLTLFIIGCDGDGIRGENFEDQMTREAMCVVASERFLLYKEAERHRQHGLASGKARFSVTSEINDFEKRIHSARLILGEMSKEYNAEFLRVQCDKAITVLEFESV